MTAKYLRHFPKPLLDDLVSGCWLPIVGSGLSRNAFVSSRQPLPLWDELGQRLAKNMPGYDHHTPLETISAFEHDFKRPKLVEQLSDLLAIRESSPGPVHQEFCSIQFDIVCTTNLDFLLERQYERAQRPCTPLISQDQLSIGLPRSMVRLLKLHGDLNHPERMVVSEEDYDLFLTRYPMIATYLANLLITRTSVLIGYSLNDPDFRQLWSVIGERLGQARRQAYVLSVGTTPAETARFDRRGFKVINLGKSKARYGEILSTTFNELSEYWRSSVVFDSQIMEEESLSELSLSRESTSRICCFSFPISIYPFYYKFVFPLVREVGLVPVTASTLISSTETYVARFEAIISRSLVAIVDISSETSVMESRMIIERKRPEEVCIITENHTQEVVNTKRSAILVRPDITTVEATEFIESLRAWLGQSIEGKVLNISSEPRRLLDLGEYRSSVISAITLLEKTLNERLGKQTSSIRRAVSIGELVNIAKKGGLLRGFECQEILRWIKVRNDVVHRHTGVSRKAAIEIVNGVDELLDSLGWDTE